MKKYLLTAILFLSSFNYAQDSDYGILGSQISQGTFLFGSEILAYDVVGECEAEMWESTSMAGSPLLRRLLEE